MDLKILNKQQLEAVTAPMGPVLVLAGAGSGKTRVLTYRIAYLIEEGLVPAENILAITFTNKAAKEMQSRVVDLLNSEVAVHRPTMGTFHSVCARLLRKEIIKLGYSPSFTIYDTDDQQKVIRDVCDELNIDKKFSPSLFRSYISSAKNIVQTPEHFDLGLSGYLSNMVQSVYAKYQNSLHRQNAVDFDDLLLLVIKLFENSTETKKYYQNIFKYILVDEYQDTNVAQYRLLSNLITNNNIFVVGDDAQSIYRFRGSSIANILNFEHDYPNSTVVTLTQNYRSTKHILSVSGSVIKQNQNQKPKELWTESSGGDKVVIHEAEDEYLEAEFVAKKIVDIATGKKTTEVAEQEFTYEQEEKPFSILDQFLKKSKIKSLSYNSLPVLPSSHGPLSNFAILYRTHSQSRAIEDVLVKSGIPYKIIGGVRFYDRKEIKDALSYLRLVLNIFDLVSLKRVLNEPARGLGDKAYAAIKQVIESLPNTDNQNLSQHEEVIKKISNINLQPKQKTSAIKFFQLLNNIASMPEEVSLSKLMEMLIKDSGLKDNLDDGTEMGENRKENINELLNVASKFNNKSWQEGSLEFLEEVALVTDAETANDKKDAVTLMTLHSAKGLEFETVFFVGLEEGILPHSRSLTDPEELAEEIRLAYVGMTRAQKRLYLVYARQRTIYGSFKIGIPSRVIASLPSESITGNRPHYKKRSARVEGELDYEQIDF